MIDTLPPEEELDLLAAELALGLLEGDERLAAERREAADPMFAAQVAAWIERLAPMLGAVSERVPPETVWSAIERAVEGAPAEAPLPGNVVQLRRKVSLWRGYSAGMTALAACLALVVGLDVAGDAPVPVVATTPQTPPPLLAAALAPEGGPVGATAAFDMARGELILTPAGMALEQGRDAELWIVPKSGDPRSLGVLQSQGPARITLRPELAVMLRDSGTLAISSEPRGGSPTGLPTGPIVAAGTLTQI